MPVSPGDREVVKFVGKMKSQMERVLDHMHVPKEFYIAE